MKVVAGIVISILSVTAILLACGPFINTLEVVTRQRPADAAAYFKGDLGVVRPRFDTTSLVEYA